VNNMNFRKKVK